MNVRYLGTRLNKRQARGAVTGKRYGYSSGQPTFTIDPADELQFHGEMEDGKPKFSYEYAGGPSLQPTDVVTGQMTVEEITALTIGAMQLHFSTYNMSRDDLETLMHLEDIGKHRTGAYAAITAALNALD